MGGTFISAVEPVLQSLTSSSSTSALDSPVYSYLLGCTVTIIVGLCSLAVITFLISFLRIKTSIPSLNLLGVIAESLPYAVYALEEGGVGILGRLDEYIASSFRHQISRMRSERDEAYKYFGGYFTALVERSTNRQAGAEGFVDFATVFCNQLRMYLLVPRDSFRIAIYCLDNEREDFFYVAGSARQSDTHTQTTIPFEGTLAGYAWINQHIPHTYVEGVDTENILYRPSTRLKFMSTIACSVSPVVSLQRSDLPNLVLCVDYKHDIRELESYSHIQRVILFQATAFALACAGMQVSDRELMQSICQT